MYLTRVQQEEAKHFPCKQTGDVPVTRDSITLALEEKDSRHICVLRPDAHHGLTACHTTTSKCLA